MSRVYIAGKVGVQSYDLDLKTGALTPIGEVLEDDGAGSFLAVSKDGKVLYSLAKPGAASLSINQSTGELTYMNSVKFDIGGCSHITTASSGDSSVVLAAAYGGGGMNITKIKEDGCLAEVESGTSKKHVGGGSNVYKPAKGNEQEDSHPHQCIVDRSGKWALVSDLGQDKVYVYAIDPAAGTMSEHSTVSTAPGAGPRHMCFHSNGRYVYGLNELDCTVSVYKFSPAGEKVLEQIGTPISTLPDGYNNRDHPNAKNANGEKASGPNRPEQTNATADIHITPDGKFLYASNRGHDSLVCYSVGGDGLLKLENFTYVRGEHPRNFNIHPSGKWLLVANQDSNNVVVFKLDAKTGQLTYSGCEISVKTARCIEFAPILKSSDPEFTSVTIPFVANAPDYTSKRLGANAFGYSASATRGYSTYSSGYPSGYSSGYSRSYSSPTSVSIPFKAHTPSYGIPRTTVASSVYSGFSANARGYSSGLSSPKSVTIPFKANTPSYAAPRTTPVASSYATSASARAAPMMSSAPVALGGSGAAAGFYQKYSQERDIKLRASIDSAVTLHA